MIIEKNRWHYRVYKFASEMSNDKGKGKTTNFCTYWRRVLLYAPLIALVMLIAIVFFFVIVALVNVVANSATILFGYGVVFCFHEEKTMRIPFNVMVHGERYSLSKFLMPFWLIVVVGLGLWFGFSTSPDAMIWAFKWIGVISAVVIVCFVLYLACGAAKEKLTQQHDGPIAEGWRLTKVYLKARKEKICPLIEFVEPDSHDKPPLSESPPA